MSEDIVYFHGVAYQNNSSYDHKSGFFNISFFIVQFKNSISDTV